MSFTLTRKECPLIDTCDDRVSAHDFKAFCRTGRLSMFIYKDCCTYKNTIYKYADRRKPREWKKEKKDK